MPRPRAGSALVGRTAELATVARLLDRAVAGDGGALVLQGEVGIGRTVLLEHACTAARERSMRVLRVSAHEAERAIPFAAAHGLLRLLGEESSSLSARKVVLAVVGRGGQDDRPQRVGAALLDLLIADRTALFVAVDDGHWLDQPSWEALTFVCRGLAGQPVAVAITMLDTPQARRWLSSAGLPELAVGRLRRPSAARLFARAFPGKSLDCQADVLDRAEGNPLALLELGVPGPLSTRAMRSLAGATAELPVATRAILQVAAMDATLELPVVLAAARTLTGDADVGDAHLLPAVRNGLVVNAPGGPAVRWCHPLLAPALRQAMGAAERIAVHAAVASVLSTDPQRRTWHRAGAATEPDENLARDLCTIADEAIMRGDDHTAATALRRAAEVSADPTNRARRLLRAVGRLADLGRPSAVAELLEQIDEDAFRGPERTRLAWLREDYLGSRWTGAAWLPAVAATATLSLADGEHVLALETLDAAALRVYWSNVDSRTRTELLRVADQLDVPRDDPRLLNVLTRVAPIERGAAVLDQLATGSATTPNEQYLRGIAASAVGAFDLAMSLLGQATEGLRRQGSLGKLVRAHMVRAWAAARLGETRQGLLAAAGCESLARETGFPMWAVTAHIVRGQLEALRGNSTAALARADEGEQIFLPMGAHFLLSMVQLIRGIEALAGGRPKDAFDALHQIFDPNAMRFHPYVRLHAVGLLAEAAIQSGHSTELAAVVAELSPIADTSRSPVLVRGLAYARAVLASNDDAEEQFETALAADLATWRFERARLQLAYGAWLRRHRRPAASRPLLRSAAMTFDALGVTPWAQRAGRELAATGESLQRGEDRREHLTPQELQIAQLAAQGLTNREIAERLFVSPRTVTTHLYRIYPKVGVTSRTELARALEQ